MSQRTDVISATSGFTAFLIPLAYIEPGPPESPDRLLKIPLTRRHREVTLEVSDGISGIQGRFASLLLVADIRESVMNMLARSCRTRAVTSAYLFGPPRFLTRDDATRVHGGVCAEMKQDDFSFQYSTPPQETGNTRAFAVLMQRREGRGGIRVTLDCADTKKAAFRLLIEDGWPSSPQHVVERADMVASAVFRELEGARQIVLAEARIQAQANVPGGDAVAFIRKHLVQLPECLGKDPSLKPRYLSARIDFADTWPSDENQLEGPIRELTMEVLKEDPRCVYIDVMSQWRQVPSSEVIGPMAPGHVRQFDEHPRVYIEDTEHFLRRMLATFEEGERE